MDWMIAILIPLISNNFCSGQYAGLCHAFLFFFLFTYLHPSIGTTTGTTTDEKLGGTTHGIIVVAPMLLSQEPAVIGLLEIVAFHTFQLCILPHVT